MAKSDAELIKRTLNGDETAFGFLVDKYKGAVHALAYRKLDDFHTAEEITQDTFLLAHRKLATLKDHRCFPGWLYVIAARCCISWKRRNRIAELSFDNVDMSRMQRLAWAKYADVRLHEDLHDALKALPENERTVLTLHHLGGLTYEEISHFIGVSRQSIKNRLYRARIRLKKEMLLAVEETFSGFQLSPNFTRQLVRQIRGVKPTPTPSGKPIAPWIAATSVVVMVILGGLGRFHDTPSPIQNRAINRESVTQIYFTAPSIIETRAEKPKLLGGASVSRQSDVAVVVADSSAQLPSRRGDISGRVMYKNSGKPAADVPILAVGPAPSNFRLRFCSTRKVDFWT